MRILALETSDKIGSVAAIADGNPLAELILDRKQRSAQSLLPAVDSLLKQVGWRPADVQVVGVSIGPGSFTGLRVGVTAAKVFAYAVGAEVLGVNTLEAIAANCGDTPCNEVSVVIDAQRGELVVQSFVRQADGSFAPAGAEELLDADVWLARLEAVGSGQSAVESGQGPGVRDQGSEIHPSSLIPHPSSVVTGPGLVRLRDRLPSGVVTLDEDLWRPRAAVVGRLAARYYAQGRRDDLWKLVPHYYRRSAAEEKWDAGGLSQFSSQRKWDCPP
jgi:tRNA threonylcarbamoyladenosine biosynthesis protein TsaB